LRERLAREHPDLVAPAGPHCSYGGWLIGFMAVDPETRTAPGIRIEHPALGGGPIAASWRPGEHYLVRQVPEWDGCCARCVVTHAYLLDPQPPVPEAALVTSTAVFGDDTPAPAVLAAAPGVNGIGPHLLDADGGPVRGSCSTATPTTSVTTCTARPACPADGRSMSGSRRPSPRSPAAPRPDGTGRRYLSQDRPPFLRPCQVRGNRMHVVLQHLSESFLDPSWVARLY